MQLGLSLALTAQRGGEPPIITAVVFPSISLLDDGDTIGPALSANYDQTSNYASSEGTIASAVATITVNGASATTSTEVTFEDVVLLEVLVTDSESNTRTFRAGRVVPADVVPGEPDPGEIEDFVLVDNGDSTFSWSGSAISLIEENPDFSWAYDFSEGDGGEENEVVEPTNPPDSVDGDPITTENETVVEGDDEITFTLEVV